MSRDFSTFFKKIFSLDFIGFVMGTSVLGTSAWRDHLFGRTIV
jgi:hypothetical protein